MSGEDETFEATGSAQRVGEKLRAARETQGLTIEEIANSTRIPKRHLTTIESGDYQGLPAPTYSAGFIKSWARRLGLDGQALSDQFRVEMGGVPVEPSQALPYEPADPRRTPPAGLALFAVADRDRDRARLSLLARHRRTAERGRRRRDRSGARAAGIAAPCGPARTGDACRSQSRRRDRAAADWPGRDRRDAGCVDQGFRQRQDALHERAPSRRSFRSARRRGRAA